MCCTWYYGLPICCWWLWHLIEPFVQKGQSRLLVAAAMVSAGVQDAIDDAEHHAVTVYAIVAIRLGWHPLVGTGDQIETKDQVKDQFNRQEGGSGHAEEMEHRHLQEYTWHRRRSHVPINRWR
jgi:hypothetical protein